MAGRVGGGERGEELVGLSRIDRLMRRTSCGSPTLLVKERLCNLAICNDTPLYSAFAGDVESLFESAEEKRKKEAAARQEQ